MKKLMNYLMLSCQKAAALIDKKSLFGLTRKEKMMLKMHTSMCDICTAYQKQSLLLDKFLHSHIHSDNKNIVIANEKLKEQIILKLNRA